jgi:hypothetical protein
MWHAGKQYSEEEIKILRELEYDLFMFDPGFRSAWNNNFEQYFKALFDEQLWEKHRVERSRVLDQDMSLKMASDPEFSKFMQHQSLIDSVLFGDFPIDNAPIEVQQEVKEIYRESEEANRDMKLQDMLGIPFIPEPNNDPWQKDSLFNLAFEWGDTLGSQAATIYEKDKNLEIFRILNNCTLVGSKMISAIDYEPFPGEDWQWRLDRIGYTLSLTSVRRCLESLNKLNNVFEQFKVESFIETARQIQQELIDRLDKIEQSRLMNKK